MRYYGGGGVEEKIEKLREKLHNLFELNNKEEILRVSRELDELLIQYHKEEIIKRDKWGGSDEINILKVDS